MNLNIKGALFYKTVRNYLVVPVVWKELLFLEFLWESVLFLNTLLFERNLSYSSSSFLFQAWREKSFLLLESTAEDRSKRGSLFSLKDSEPLDDNFLFSFLILTKGSLLILLLLKSNFGANFLSSSGLFTKFQI